MASLKELLEHTARRCPDQVAVEEVNGQSIRYRDLRDLAEMVAGRLGRLGVEPGERVGIYLHKSIDAVAAIFGTLSAGAAYVPVDPTAPVSRNALILDDCAVRALFVERRWIEPLRAVWGERSIPALVPLDDVGGGAPLRKALAYGDWGEPLHRATPDPNGLAYLLYTSGSTGKPKGVPLTHENALSFIDWCSQTFQPSEQDCFSSHAPFHFDLSIHDLYVPIKHGARLVLIGEKLAKEPLGLAATIAEKRISIWYSVPSVLALLAQYGKLARHDYGALRLVLFAGEVFPIPHLRRLRALLPAPRYFNLYGPTETNVCTYYELPNEIPPDRTAPYPIGATCPHLRTIVVDSAAKPAKAGDEGELCVAGSSVMQGYWELPEENERAFLDRDGERWYRTGDVVVENADGLYEFRGRRDRMVKRRGYRVELGEIEAGLYQHPSIQEAAVVALDDEDTGLRIKAFLVCRDGQRPSLIALKSFCAQVLPSYMIPDTFQFGSTLPTTSTGKLDYQRLKEDGAA